MNEPLSDNARKVFEAMPQEGKVGGITLRDKMGMGMADFRLAKGELKLAGLVELGKGRGGSLGRVEGAELPPEVEKLSKEQSLELAREAKQEKSERQKKSDILHEKIIEAGERLHPGADEIVPGFYDGTYYIEVWNDGVAKMDFTVERELEL